MTVLILTGKVVRMVITVCHYSLPVSFITLLHREPLPGHWDDDLDEFQKLLVLRCIRADKVTNAMQVGALY